MRFFKDYLRLWSKNSTQMVLLGSFLKVFFFFRKCDSFFKSPNLQKEKYSKKLSYLDFNFKIVFWNIFFFFWRFEKHKVCHSNHWSSAQIVSNKLSIKLTRAIWNSNSQWVPSMQWTPGRFLHKMQCVYRTHYALWYAYFPGITFRFLVNAFFGIRFRNLSASEELNKVIYLK